MFGIEVEQPMELDPEEGRFGVLEENVPVVDAFLAVRTQLTATGFRYEGVEAGLRLAGVTVSSELFDGLRVMEDAVLAHLAERTERQR